MNEAKHWPPGKDDEFWSDEPEDDKKKLDIHTFIDGNSEFDVKMNGPEAGGTHLSPWINDKSKEEPKTKIHPIFTKKSGGTNSFGLNEKEN